MMIGGIPAPAPSSGHTENYVILTEWSQRFISPAPIAGIVAMAKFRMFAALGTTRLALHIPGLHDDVVGVSGHISSILQTAPRSRKHGALRVAVSPTELCVRP